MSVTLKLNVLLYMSLRFVIPKQSSTEILFFLCQEHICDTDKYSRQQTQISAHRHILIALEKEYIELGILISMLQLHELLHC